MIWLAKRKVVLKGLSSNRSPRPSYRTLQFVSTAVNQRFNEPHIYILKHFCLTLYLTINWSILISKRYHVVTLNAHDVIELTSAARA